MILSQTFDGWNNENIWSTKSKIAKNNNGENVPNFKINEVVLVHCNIANSDYQQDSRV